MITPIEYDVIGISRPPPIPVIHGGVATMTTVIREEFIPFDRPVCYIKSPPIVEPTEVPVYVSGFIPDDPSYIQLTREVNQSIELLADLTPTDYVVGIPPLTTYAGNTPIYDSIARDVANWSQYPAVSDVNFSDKSILNIHSIQIDNQFLDATPIDLLLNGVPIATIDNLPNINDWSLYPAIQQVDMATFPILLGGSVITATGNTILANGVNPVASWASFVGSAQLDMGGNAIINTPSVRITGHDVTTGVGNNILVNAIDPVASWASYVGSGNVDMGTYNIVNAGTITLGGSVVSAVGNSVLVNTVNPVSSWSSFPARDNIECSQFSLVDVSGVNCQTVLIKTDLAGGVGSLTVNPTGTALLFNGTAVSVGGNDKWSVYPALQTVDFDIYDLKDTGSINTGNALGKSVILGTELFPLVTGAVLANQLSLTHFNPVTQASIKSYGAMRIEAQLGDLDIIGDDVNIATTGSTNILNITSLAGIQNTAGGFWNVTAGGAMAVQAGGLISILTPGQINIGSGNLFGFTTSIEKFDFNDNEVGKVSGAVDLVFNNVGEITNDNTISVNSGMVLQLTGNSVNLEANNTGNIRFTTDYASGLAGNIIFNSGVVANALVVSGITGVGAFAVPPTCAVAPTTGTQLTNKSYVDSRFLSPTLTNLTVTGNTTTATLGATTSITTPLLNTLPIAGNGNGIQIGNLATSTDANSIVINATGVALDSLTTNAIYIAPIRPLAASVSSLLDPLVYNVTTKELQVSLDGLNNMSVVASGGTINLTRDQKGKNIVLTGNSITAFTTAGFAAGDAGFFVYVKNGGTQDITLNLVSPKTLFGSTASQNAGIIWLYFDGTNLVGY